MKTDKNEKLQSRREFFKSAAKVALPIIGAVVLANVPAVNAVASTGCDYTCKTSCQNDCYGSCHYGCKSTCSGSCSGSSKR